jgi:unsaturated chondroitin disaccharide hydrolase
MQRYRPAGCYVQAWREVGDPREGGRIIIEMMMILSLVFWASQQTGHARYRDVARAHAETSRRYLLRPHRASCHTFLFDQNSGETIGPSTHQGCADHSLWARGQAWAIHGLASAAQWCGDDAYLQASRRRARRFMAELPSRGVPTWGLRLPPGAPRYQDSPAATIAAAGLLRLARLEGGSEDGEFHRAAWDLLASLVANSLETDRAALGLLRDGSSDAYKGWGVEECFICGDYFLMETRLSLQGGCHTSGGPGRYERLLAWIASRLGRSPHGD